MKNEIDWVELLKTTEVHKEMILIYKQNFSLHVTFSWHTLTNANNLHWNEIEKWYKHIGEEW